MTIYERAENHGLGRSILAGVTEVLSHHDACLVFEDDLICVPGTYQYLSSALTHYRDTPQVMSVTGWTHPQVTPTDVEDQCYFDGRAECLVWGTWARAWSGMNDQTAFEMMMTAERQGCERDAYGGDLPAMAEAESRLNIWAVRWLYHHIRQRGLCLRPPWSMVEHIGFDARATNASSAERWANPPLRACPPIPIDWPTPVEHPSCAHLHQRAFPAPAVGPPPTLVRRLVRFGQRKVRSVTAGAALADVSPRRAVQALAPPILWQALRAWRRSGLGAMLSGHAWGERLQLTGDCPSWEAAVADSTGYDAAVILERTRAALSRVKQGEAVYERDSVLFDEIHYAWPLLAGLTWAAARHGGKLVVLDFGGSLGSTWFQNRDLLRRLPSVRWNVVEQPAYVAVGQREFADETLRFYPSVRACVAEQAPNVIVLSGVLQYLEQPYDLLDELQQLTTADLIIDRTPFWAGSFDRLCVQHVPPEIYPASYPSWLFAEMRFRSILSLHWDELAGFDCPDRLPGPVPFAYRGLIATRRASAPVSGGAPMDSPS
ncbi:MAG: methyltransferase, TIGR04325 family [Chromatiaceae bacterium]|nr:methyltransferase, TIGR04325 family [Chromatiaceae bacterium]